MRVTSSAISRWRSAIASSSSISSSERIAAKVPLCRKRSARDGSRKRGRTSRSRSEEHTSELQSRVDLVCRLLLEKKKKIPLPYSNEYAHRQTGKGTIHSHHLVTT